jgi:hypothetical protein
LGVAIGAGKHFEQLGLIHLQGRAVVARLAVKGSRSKHASAIGKQPIQAQHGAAPTRGHRGIHQSALAGVNGDVSLSGEYFPAQ